MSAAALAPRRADHHPDPDRGPRRAVLLLVGLLVLFAALAFAWAAAASIDVSVSSRGAVVPPSRLQEVQSLEGGILRQMLVQPGQRVHKGDVLVRLDAAQFDADLGESQQTWLATLATRARFEALLSGGAPRFDPRLEQQAPQLVQQEQRLWREAVREYESTVSAGQEGVRRRSGELAEAKSRIESLQVSFKVAQEAFEIEERLLREGATARADYLSAQQRMLAQRTELDGMRASIPRLEAGLSEARAQAAEAGARMRTQWGSQRAEVEGRSAGLSSTIKGREDKVARRELRAPINGVVNRVLITTLGGVASPGTPILEIVPDESALRVMVRVKPSDIGFIHVGQKASVRLPAYDYAIYGKLAAQVERVASDTVLDENKQPYFEVELRTDANHLVHNGKQLAISTGMPAEASVLTGKRTVLQYMLKPLFRSFDSALQER